MSTANVRQKPALCSAGIQEDIQATNETKVETRNAVLELVDNCEICDEEDAQTLEVPYHKLRVATTRNAGTDISHFHTRMGFHDMGHRGYMLLCTVVTL